MGIMDFDEYQKRAAETDLATAGHDQTYARMYLCMGLAGEAGEVVEKVKHIIRDKSGVVSDEAKEHLKKEIGDVLWYASQIAQSFGVSFGEAAQHNLDKLADRAQRGVLHGNGDTR